jgi:hypothetical protein
VVRGGVGVLRRCFAQALIGASGNGFPQPLEPRKETAELSTTLCRKHFQERSARPGHAPTISAEMIAGLIAKTTQSPLVNATQWSTRSMAREAGISKASVSRIWRANGLKPHRVDTFKVSNDPQFADKLEAMSAPI